MHEPKGTPRKTLQGGAKQTSDAERVLRRNRAVQLRAGHTGYAQIAKELGIGLGTAWNDVQAGLRDEIAMRREDREAVRTLELHRLDLAGAVLIVQIRDGDAETQRHAIFGLLKVMERRARYLGLDAPAKMEHSGAVRVDLDEIRKRTGEEWEPILERSLAALRAGRMQVTSEPGGGAPQNGSGNGSE